MLDIGDLRWLAGILEGEGCFRISLGGRVYKDSGEQRKTPVIVLEMTDSDIVYKAASIMSGGQKVRARDRRGIDYRGINHQKVIYNYTITATPAVEWMMTLYSLMGNRRKEKIREILDIWKTQTNLHAVARYRDTCLNGHEWTLENTRLVHGSKVCRVCDRLNAAFHYKFIEFSKEYPNLKPEQLREKFYEINDKQELN